MKAIAESIEPPRGQLAVGPGMEIDWTLYPHFNPEQDTMLACPCCNGIFFNQKLLEMVEAARCMAGVPFNVTSGCRCKAHNAWLYRNNPDYKETSSHEDGEAIDVEAPNNFARFRIVMAALHVGFRRLGLGPNFVHMDISRTKRQDIIWTYMSDPNTNAMSVRFNSLKGLMCRYMANDIVVSHMSICHNLESKTQSLALAML